MRRQRREGAAPEVEMQACGAFMPDGSWNAHCSTVLRGHVHRLVESLVRQRKGGTLRPETAANLILAANALVPFPNAKQWATAVGWRHVWCSTSAEAMVQHGGVDAARGHWCGEAYVRGDEKDCAEVWHRPDKGNSLEIRQMVQAVIGALPVVSRGTQGGPSLHVGGQRADDTYFRTRGPR